MTRAYVVVSSPTFPGGELVFFIPSRVVAEQSGAAHLDLPGGPPGGGAAGGRTMVMSPAAPFFVFATNLSE